MSEPSVRRYSYDEIVYRQLYESTFVSAADFDAALTRLRQRCAAVVKGPDAVNQDALREAQRSGDPWKIAEAAIALFNRMRDDSEAAILNVTLEEP